MLSCKLYSIVHTLITWPSQYYNNHYSYRTLGLKQLLLNRIAMKLNNSLYDKVK